MKRLSFLLLDANVVIYLFEHRLWERLVETCDVHLARTVIDEAHFYEDDDGVRELELYALRQAGFEAEGYATTAGFRAALEKMPMKIVGQLFQRYYSYRTRCSILQLKTIPDFTGNFRD